MKYMKIEFTSGLEGQGYMEIDSGSVTRLTDLEGTTLIDFINSEFDIPVCEYHIIDKKPVTPEWANV